MVDSGPSALPREGRASPTALPSGTVTFLFTDIEGSTPLFAALGERYEPLLQVHNALIGESVARHGGVIIRTAGDSFFAAFAEAVPAVTAALDAQLALLRHQWPEDAAFGVRMGLHTGAAVPTDGDYVALAVHQAARISDTGHGGQVVLSETTRELVAEQLPGAAWTELLGPYRLRGFAEPVVLHQLCHPDIPGRFPALRALPAAAHNVPAPATLFVGRDTALAELARLVRGRRLVTVLGAGGVGKTRLAVELIPKVTEAFADGVWLVELARLGRGMEIAAEVAAALGVRTGTDERASVIDALRTKQLLVVLDNCEHVIDSAAALAEGLVAGCPQVTLLCTSREPLALPIEQRFPLSPLTVPTGADPELVGQSEAVALFVDRAKAASPSFDLPREAAAVAEICRRLDGLPLAIELAAARAGALSVSSLAARLDRRFSVLTRGHRGALAHHETLSASIRWSVELLEPDEQILFRRLGVFRGEFDLEAAEAVCSVAPLHSDAVLDLLVRLVEKSLVQAVDHRYVLLDSIRDFASDQLSIEGERDALRRAHLDYYADLAERCARIADGPELVAAFDRLDTDFSNLRAAVEFALERSDEAALRLGAALGQYGFVRNHLNEVANWAIAAVAAAPDAPARLSVGALTQAGFALVVLGSVGDGLAMVDRSLGLVRSVADDQLLVDTLLMAADLRLESGLVQEACAPATEALASALTLADDWRLARATYVEAMARRAELGYEETHRRLGRAAELFVRVDDRRQEARVSLSRALLSLGAGELDAAETEAGRCFEIADAIDHPIGRAMARSVQLWTELERGELSRAGDLLVEVGETARASGYIGLLGMTVAASAVMSARERAHERAARVIGALDASPGALVAEDFRAISVRVERLRAELVAALGEGRFAELAAVGARIPLDELI